MSEQRKAVIKNADMEEKMQQDAVDIASKALSEYNIEKVRIWVCSTGFAASCSSASHLFFSLQDVAAYIKKEFDRKHGTTW